MDHSEYTGWGGWISVSPQGGEGGSQAVHRVGKVDHSEYTWWGRWITVSTQGGQGGEGGS